MKLFVPLLVLGMVVAKLGAEERLTWPRFRGPNGSGVAEGQKPPVEFGPEKNVKWKVPAPSGLSSPVIAGDKLVITALEGDKLYTGAYNRADGKEAWRAEAPAKKIEPYLKGESSPAASTCVTDGERVVSYFGSCGLVCYDLAGKELWKFELPIAPSAGGFGTGASPMLTDGKVILVRDEIGKSRILALDVATGAPLWEQKRQSPSSNCTPILWDTPAGKQVVAAGHARMVGYDLKSGEQKWSVTGMPSGCCASPVVADGTLFFAGWSPGGADDKENQMPAFDDVLKGKDKDKDSKLSREEGDKDFEGFFDSLDANKDGFIVKDEYDIVLK